MVHGRIVPCAAFQSVMHITRCESQANPELAADGSFFAKIAKIPPKKRGILPFGPANALFLPHIRWQ